jgi:hypothetical protein
MKKKVLIFAVVLLLFGWGTRVCYVNTTAQHAQEEVYQSGEAVPIGQNLFSDNTQEKMNGYFVTAKSAALKTPEAFLKQFGKPLSYLTEQELEQQVKTIAVYEVHIVVQNKNNPYLGKFGIDFFPIQLLGTDYWMTEDNQLYALANPSMKTGSTKITLKEGQSFEFILPYKIYDRDKSILKTIEKEKPKLILSQFPVRKLIQL